MLIMQLSRMWRLKVAEGGGPYEPYLYSTNNFVGRQIWEFDPNYGTPEERAEVEKARELFTLNRSRVKPSSDVLLRLEVCPLLIFSSPPPNNDTSSFLLQCLKFQFNLNLRLFIFIFWDKKRDCYYNKNQYLL